MIRIQNIYYMLAYAFQTLKESGYSSCATEDFENALELLSAILARGVSMQIKRGLAREYVENCEAIGSLRGKIDVTASIKTQVIQKQTLYCVYDEFSPNSYMNRILKTTMRLLLHSDITKSRKKELARLLPYFKDVEPLDRNRIDWNINITRNHSAYHMLLNVCYLVIAGLLQTENDGTTKLAKFLDEQHMCRLYEKFIFEYYKKEFPDIKVSAAHVPWSNAEGDVFYLPAMRTDVTLTYHGRTLIIDAKYYGSMMQHNYEKLTFHSGNLYQIYTYVKNRDVLKDGSVAGILLYAKTDEDVTPNSDCVLDGNRIGIRTLDLGAPFAEVAKQLDGIVEQF